MKAKNLAKTALAAFVFAVGSAASAEVTCNPNADAIETAATLFPSNLTFSGGTLVACSGFFSGNYLSGNDEDVTKTAAAFASMGFATLGNGGNYTEKLTGGYGGGNDSGTAVINFAQGISGRTALGFHFGTGGGSNISNPSAFFIVDFGLDLVDSFTLSGFGPLGGLSNAGVYTTAPIPEPETYALMLAGLGAVAFMARRRKAAQKA